MNDKEKLFNRRVRLPECIKQNIQIEGDVGAVKIKEVSLKEIIMAKSQSCVASTGKKQPKSGTEQVLRSSPRQKEENQDNEIIT